MNYLPHHRRIQAGRTWSSPWRASDSDPISHYRRPIPLGERIAGVMLAMVVGIGTAALLLHYWAKGW